MQFCIMEKLNFHDFDFSFKSKENKTYIFDPIRKKWLVLNPGGMGSSKLYPIPVEKKMFH